MQNHVSIYLAATKLRSYIATLTRLQKIDSHTVVSSQLRSYCYEKGYTDRYVLLSHACMWVRSVVRKPVPSSEWRLSIKFYKRPLWGAYNIWSICAIPRKGLFHHTTKYLQSGDLREWWETMYAQEWPIFVVNYQWWVSQSWKVSYSYVRSCTYITIRKISTKSINHQCI